MNSLSGKQYINHDQKNQIICATKKKCSFCEKNFCQFFEAVKALEMEMWQKAQFPYKKM